MPDPGAARRRGEPVAGSRRLLRAVPLVVLLLTVGTGCAATSPEEAVPPEPIPTVTAAFVTLDAGGAGWGMAATPEHLWIQVDPPVDAIVRIDKVSGFAEPLVPGGWRVRTGEEGLWVSCCDWSSKIDPQTGEELFRVEEGGLLALAAGAAWLYTEEGNLLRIEAESGDVRSHASIDPSACVEGKDLLIAFGSAWLACKEGAVVRIDLDAGTSTSLSTPGGTHTFAATDDAVWVTNYTAGSVTRIDPETETLTEIPGAGSGIGITVGGGFVWAADAGGIAQIDPAGNEIVGHMELGRDRLYELVWEEGVIWASTATEEVLKIDVP
jgi:hypothetical protein